MLSLTSSSIQIFATSSQVGVDLPFTAKLKNLVAFVFIALSFD